MASDGSDPPREGGDEPGPSLPSDGPEAAYGFGVTIRLDPDDEGVWADPDGFRERADGFRERADGFRERADGFRGRADAFDAATVDEALSNYLGSSIHVVDR